MQKLVIFYFLLIFLFHKNFATDSKKEKIAIVNYKIKENLKPRNLIDISNKQIDEHWELYKGYVEHVNKLNHKLTRLRNENKSNTLEYSDRRRRYGFEYNGMILHEYYFENLKTSKKNKPSGKLLKMLKKYFGSFQNWLDDFKQAGKTRGIGWVILYQDPTTDQLINTYIQDHEIGIISTFKPLLVMDIWEHAFMIDYGATKKSDYIEAFIKNINWPIVEKRFEQ